MDVADITTDSAAPSVHVVATKVSHFSVRAVTSFTIHAAGAPWNSISQHRRMWMGQWGGPDTTTAQLSPLLDDLLAGRRPVTSTLTEVDIKAIALVSNAS